MTISSSSSSSSSHLSLAVTQRPIATLYPDPQNARVHSPRQIKQICKSMASFGNVVPLLIDRDGLIIAGHGRLEAAKKLGLTEIPVIQLDHLTPAQAKAFAIADNRLAEQATWDENLLGQIFADLSLQDISFSLEDTGFTMAEIDIKIESIVNFDIGSSATKDRQTQDPADFFDAPDGAQAVTQLGDLWHVGKHRVQCGNALSDASVSQLMGGKQAHMGFIDPPFNVKVDGHVSGNGKHKHRELPMASGEMTPDEFTQFLQAAFKQLVTHSINGSIHFVCMDWRHLAETLAAGNTIFTALKNICAWVKSNAGMGSLYRSQHELILVFKNGSAPHRNNIELGKYGRYRTNVWNYPGANALSRQPGEENLLALHPTVKPVQLVADTILDCSARGDVVLDSFLGSGTTLLASERVGRVCYGKELDPLYVDTAIRRWQTLTGEHAIHAATGQTFNQRAADLIPSGVPGANQASATITSNVAVNHG